MSQKGKSSRHRGREVALQTLYAIDVGRRPRPGALPSQQDESERAAAESAGAESAAAD